MTTVSRHVPAAFACFATLLVQLGAMAAAPEPTREQVRFFEEKVRPILAENCYKCHGSDKQKGSLRLDVREAVLAGGESGPVIVPGKPDESALVEAIKWQALEMPPTGKLSDSQIATLTEWIRLGAPMPKDHGGGSGVSVRKTRGIITDEDRQWWAFQPIRRPAVPTPARSAREGSPGNNPIDAFLLARQHAEGLSPAPEADKRTLIRRLSFDLIGLPPTTEEIDAFLADQRPDAYERLVERLLASPHHGEHWARHWLDLVRYAESDGYKLDAYRDNAFHYRDYVIRAFNSDKPYSQFVLEQLAGDEVAPDDPEALFATGYLRVGIYEYNQRDVKTQWAGILNDLTDVSADVFLGMGMSCARCHDHKFDPILQKDYFRLQAFFAPIHWRDDVPATSAAQIANYKRRLAEWEAKTVDIRAQLDEIEKPLRDAAVKVALDKFPDEMREIFAKPESERSPLEQQLNALAMLQTIGEETKVDYAKKLKGEKKDRWEQLRTELAEFDADKPAPIPVTPSVTDIGPVAPVVFIPGKRDAEPIEPGPLSVLDPNPLTIDSPEAVRTRSERTTLTTGRRTALARWIASPDNPLPSRVLANRLWQYHFGRGLSEAPSDFGRLGQPPSHPELLDWLASELLADDWSIKRLHRQMVTSAAYRQASHGPQVAASAAKDPANKWLARMTVRRLAAEQIRDAAIAVTDELDQRMGGEPGDWVKSSRRAVYLKVRRNTHEPTLDVFDAPDGIFTTPVRNVTTTPTQSLFMINGPWMMQRAKSFARRLASDSSATLEQRVATAYALAFGRPPTAGESDDAVEFLQTNPAKSDDAFVDLCHVLLNSNEFLYVD
jgi:uncharacterized protein DUF1549/uncharacterized protein DUF1553/cytochrome c